MYCDSFTLQFLIKLICFSVQLLVCFKLITSISRYILLLSPPLKEEFVNDIERLLLAPCSTANDIHLILICSEISPTGRTWISKSVRDTNLKLMLEPTADLVSAKPVKESIVKEQRKSLDGSEDKT